MDERFPVRRVERVSGRRARNGRRQQHRRPRRRRHGRSIAFKNLDGIAGDDPLASFLPIRDRYLEATDGPGRSETRFTSSVGEVTLDEYLGKMCPDTSIHTWDLARALPASTTRSTRARLTSCTPSAWAASRRRARARALRRRVRHRAHHRTGPAHRLHGTRPTLVRRVTSRSSPRGRRPPRSHTLVSSRDVVERVAVERDHVGVGALAEHTELALAAQQAGSVHRRGADRLGR